MKVPKSLLPETVTYEKYLGAGSYDDIYAPAVKLQARVDYENKLVRDSSGSEVVSSSSVMLHADDVAQFALGSKIKLQRDTNTRKVISGGPVTGHRGISYIHLDIE